MRASNSLRISRGRGADPLMQALMDFRSYFPTWGWLLMAMYIAGTPGKWVGFCLLMIFRTASISRGSGWRIIAPPTCTGAIIAVVRP